MRAHLRKLLGSVWEDRWKKSPTRKQPPKPSPRAYLCGEHSSVDKILGGAHRENPLKGPDDKPLEMKVRPCEMSKDNV